MVSVKKLMLSSLVLTANGLSIPVVQNYVDKVINVFEPKLNLDSIGTNVLPTVPGKDERPVPGDSPIVQCDVSEAQILNLQSVIIEPNPPARGQNLTIIAKGFLSKDIEDGAYVDVDVRYGFIKLVHQTFDLCEEVGKVDLECPIKAGQQIIIKEVEVPEEVPPGKYTVNARAYTGDDEFITCLTATVEFPASG